MLNLNGKGEVRVIRLRKDVRGEETIKAVTVILRFAAVPLEVVQAGFVSQLGLFYSRDHSLRVTELEPLKVSRHVSNVDATIAGQLFTHMIVDNVKLTLLPDRLIDVQLKLKGPIDGGVDSLHDTLQQTVEIQLVEKEFEVAKDKEGEDNKEREAA